MKVARNIFLAWVLMLLCGCSVSSDCPAGVRDNGAQDIASGTFSPFDVAPMAPNLKGLTHPLSDATLTRLEVDRANQLVRVHYNDEHGTPSVATYRIAQINRQDHLGPF